MKKLLPVCIAFLTLTALQAQNKIQLHLSARLGAAPFALNTAVSAGAYQYKITRLEYYVSQIKITHDGGQETPLTDVYLLVRPAQDSIYDLGSYPGITNVEAVTFSVGVDEPHNHLDPASYPANHPLAPQNPSMHWGWSAGYRFVAIEGTAGNNFLNDYQIHALGNALYKTVTLATGAETHDNGDKTVHLIADYAQVLKNVDVSAGLFVHGSTGKAITVMNNMQSEVFRAQTVSGSLDPAFAGTFRLSPNPALPGQAAATLGLPSGFDYRISVADLTGRGVLSRPVPADSQTFSLADDAVKPGIYFVLLWQNERPVAVEKLVITR